MSNFQYLIHEYLEGTLSEELQTFLFQEMSANDELRHELLTQIHIQQQATEHILFKWWMSITVQQSQIQ